MEKKKYKEAINAYSQGIKYNEEDEEMYYDLGIAYSMINQFPLAKKCFEKAVELNSNYYNASYRLGQISLLYRDIELAEKYFTDSIYGETESKSFYQLAKISIIKNDKTKAAMYINNAINCDYRYYEIARKEPIFFPIKNQFSKPAESEQRKIEESKKEKEISEYLDNTYSLTNKLKDNKDSKKN